jgi:hypothetical protein
VEAAATAAGGVNAPRRNRPLESRIDHVPPNNFQVNAPLPLENIVRTQKRVLLHNRPGASPGALQRNVRRRGRSGLDIDDGTRSLLVHLGRADRLPPRPLSGVQLPGWVDGRVLATNLGVGSSNLSGRATLGKATDRALTAQYIPTHCSNAV